MMQFCNRKYLNFIKYFESYRFCFQKWNKPKKTLPSWYLGSGLLLLVFACGDSATQSTASRFNGSFNGEIVTTQDDQKFGDTINLNLTAGSPLEGTFFYQSDGVVGTISGDVTENSATFTGTTSGDCSATFNGSLALINGDEISMLIEGTNCDGDFTSEGMLNAVPCIDIGGRYEVTEEVSVRCTIDGETDTETNSGGGTVFIVKNGCKIGYAVPGIDVTREGELEANALKMTGPFLIPLIEGVNFTENTFTIEENILDEYFFILNGTGNAKGTVNGIDFSCTGNSKATFRRSFNVAVAVLRGGPGHKGDVEVGSDLDMIRTQAMQVDPKRVIANGFRDGPNQLGRVEKWLDGLSRNVSVGTRVVLIGHSYGGNAVRRANFFAKLRITIDPINPLFIAIPDQRGLGFSPAITAGRFINILASTTEDIEEVKGKGLLGYRIPGAIETVESMPPTNHFTIVTRVLTSEIVSEEVQNCLDGGLSQRTLSNPNKQFGFPLTKRPGNQYFYFNFGWRSDTPSLREKL